MLYPKSAETIRRIRLTLCLSKRDFAGLLSLAPSTISMYEFGVRQPSFDTLRKLISLCQDNDIPFRLDEIRDS
jgi:transcriptional regulator with XRE-family HTH domain